MKILFLTLINIDSLESHGIYSDLLREFAKNGHEVFVVCPTEKRFNEKTNLIKDKWGTILRVKTGNITQTSVVEKGISTIKIEGQFVRVIKKYFKNEIFDLVIYSTPPITLVKTINFVKKRDKAFAYLLLKDIFPQNAIDLGMLSKKGVKGIIYKFFRNKERKLYKISDKIGCMSTANCNYILDNNREIEKEKVEVCPNCIEIQNVILNMDDKIEIRKKYGLPLDKKIFVYGGNLGKPQNIKFVVKCLKACSDIKDVFFVLAGSGTDRCLLEEYVEKENPQHVKLFGFIPKDEYDKMIACCDVGMIFLDHRFTIPNFPSRLLAYMQAGLPVLTCTDVNTDVGTVVEDNGFGWACVSDDEKKFKQKVLEAKDAYLPNMVESGMNYLNENYSSKVGYSIIVNSVSIK